MNKKSGFSYNRSIPNSIWTIGICSLLINSATTVVFSGSALYLKTVLGVSVAAIGFLEAIVEAIAYAVRIFSGMLSDYFKNRKSLMVIGFFMIAISKPILAYSKNLSHVFLSRTIDRIGNGVQASPREALISDIAPKESKGACFGLRQSLSVIGSTLGGLFGVLVMKNTNNNFELLFLLAGIPAFLAVFLLIVCVKEAKQSEHHKSEKNKIKISDLKNLGLKFWILISITMIFMMSRFSESFLALHACGNFNLDLGYVTLMTTVYNLISTFVAYPIGILSDKADKTKILLAGFVCLCLAHIMLGFAVNLHMVFIGTIIWGAQIGITQSVFCSLVSDFVPKNLRGTGFGIFYLIVALSTALASVFAGKIAESNGEAYCFINGSVLSFIAIIVLLSTRRFLTSK